MRAVSDRVLQRDNDARAGIRYREGTQYVLRSSFPDRRCHSRCKQLPPYVESARPANFRERRL